MLLYKKKKRKKLFAHEKAELKISVNQIVSIAVKVPSTSRCLPVSLCCVKSGMSLYTSWAANSGEEVHTGIFFLLGCIKCIQLSTEW
jgi:hypothetical protein